MPPRCWCGQGCGPAPPACCCPLAVFRHRHQRHTAVAPAHRLRKQVSSAGLDHGGHHACSKEIGGSFRRQCRTTTNTPLVLCHIACHYNTGANDSVWHCGALKRCLRHAVQRQLVRRRKTPTSRGHPAAAPSNPPVVKGYFCAVALYERPATRNGYFTSCRSCAGRDMLAAPGPLVGAVQLGGPVPLVPCYFNAIMVMRRRTPPGAVLAGGAAKTAV